MGREFSRKHATILARAHQRLEDVVDFRAVSSFRNGPTELVDDGRSGAVIEVVFSAKCVELSGELCVFEEGSRHPNYFGEAHGLSELIVGGLLRRSDTRNQAHRHSEEQSRQTISAHEHCFPPTSHE